MNSFKRKELPKMADGKIVGIALVEIKEVKEITKGEFEEVWRKLVENERS